MNISIAILAGVATCSIATADEPRGLRDYAVRLGTPVMLDRVVPPLALDDVHRWAQILGASEAQVNFMEVMYERFVERHNTFMDAEAPKFLEMSVKLRETRRAEGHSSPGLVEPMRRFDQAVIHLRRQLTSREHSYIDSIEPVFSEDQKERLRILRSDAVRRNCRTFYSFARWMYVELRDVWDGSAAALASRDEVEEVEAILAGYEAQLTSLTCRMADLQHEVRQRLLAHRIEFAERGPGRGSYRAGHARIVRRQVETARSITALNERTVAQIADVLAPDVAAVFIGAAKEAAFPELYPDSNALHYTFIVLTGDPLLEDDEADAVLTLFDAYRNEYDRQCSELEAFCVDWSDKNVQGIDGYQNQLLPRALAPLLEKREALARDFLSKLQEVIGAEVLERHGLSRSTTAVADAAE